MAIHEPSDASFFASYQARSIFSFGVRETAIAANMRGNLPELMLAYTNYMESIVPYMEVNAKHIFGARGIVLPSRSTTHGYNNALAPGFAGGIVEVSGAASSCSRTARQRACDSLRRAREWLRPLRPRRTLGRAT